MRKFLDQKFWSQGTPLGSMRALFSRNALKIFPNINFWAVLRVLKHPLVATFVVVFLFTGFQSSLWHYVRYQHYTLISGTFHFSLDGHGYFYSQYHPDHSEDKEDWLDARNACREYCMDLISLETPFENDMIEEFLTTSTFSSGIIPWGVTHFSNYEG